MLCLSKAQVPSLSSSWSPTTTPNSPTYLEEISMYFIIGLPKSQGFEVIVVVVDRLSKYTHFILLKHPFTAKTVAKSFVKEVVRLHGVPKAIVSDKDSIFLNNF